MQIFSKLFILAYISSLAVFTQTALCDQYDSANFYDGTLTELGEAERMRKANWGNLDSDPNTKLLMDEIDKSGENKWVNSLIKHKIERQNLEPWRTQGNVTLQFDNNNAVMELSSTRQQPAEIMQMIQLRGAAKSISFDNKVVTSSPDGRMEVYAREVSQGAVPTLLGAFPLAKLPSRIACPVELAPTLGAQRYPRRHTGSPHYEITIKLVGGTNQVRLDNFKVSY